MRVIEMPMSSNNNIPEVPHPLHSINDTKQIINPSSLSAGILPHYKGWFYQIEVQSILDNKGIKYEGASEDFYEFLKEGNNVENYDIKVTLSNGKKKIECKFRDINMLYHIFDRDFEKEWLSKLCDIIVTNNKYALSYKQRRRLELKGVLLLSTMELKNYLLKLIHPLRIGNSNRCIGNNRNNIVNRYNSTLRPAITDSTLTKYIEITASDSTKTQQKPPLLDCYSCKRRMYCELFQRIDSLHTMKPYKTQEQSLLVPTTDRKTKPFKQRLEEWRKEYHPLKAKQFLCLEKRIFLHITKNYKLFDIEHEEK